MGNKREELSDEMLEAGEFTGDEEKTLLSMLPSELQERWREAAPEELVRVVNDRKEVLDKWLKRQEQMRVERSEPEMQA